jgi:pyridinium-3,5-bisthiocarboxylic acid mononucleotide nickel chelatase
MKVAYVDMIGGVAGDMLMGAWVDAGLDVDVLEKALRTVVADGWELLAERVDRAGIAATHVDLVIPGEDERAHGHDGAHHHGHDDHGHRLLDILAIIERSGLSPLAVERARTIYRKLAETEARVKGGHIEDMIFHAVGQIDAILDVAGTCIALDAFGIGELRVSSFPLGHGMSRSGLPNPGATALELMRGFAVRMVDIEAQLVTETGAAILTTLAAPGSPPEMTLERIGYGAGSRSFAIPNVVRIMIGEPVQPSE